MSDEFGGVPLTDQPGPTFGSILSPPGTQSNALDPTARAKAARDPHQALGDPTNRGVNTQYGPANASPINFVIIGAIIIAVLVVLAIIVTLVIRGHTAQQPERSRYADRRRREETEESEPDEQQEQDDQRPIGQRTYAPPFPRSRARYTGDPESRDEGMEATRRAQPQGKVILPPNSEGDRYDPPAEIVAFNQRTQGRQREPQVSRQQAQEEDQEIEGPPTRRLSRAPTVAEKLVQQLHPRAQQGFSENVPRSNSSYAPPPPQRRRQATDHDSGEILAAMIEADR